MNDGKSFESLTASIYEHLSRNEENTSVERDVKLSTRDGTKRQFDVVIRTQSAGTNLLVVVEAKDWASPVKVEVIDALAAKMRSVGAHKGIVVSRNGFQAGAITEAASYGIEICTAHDVSNLSSFKAQVPVVVHYLPLNHYSIRTKVPGAISKNQHLDPSAVYVEGRRALDMFREDLMTGKIKPRIRRPLSEREVAMIDSMRVGGPVIEKDDYDEPMNSWEPNSSQPAKYHDPISGYTVRLPFFRIDYHLTYEYYFGYLNDLPSTIGLDNITESRSSIFFDPKDIVDFKDKFKRFENLEDVAVSEAINFHCMGHIDPGVLSGLAQQANQEGGN